MLWVQRIGLELSEMPAMLEVVFWPEMKKKDPIGSSCGSKAKLIEGKYSRC